MKQRSTDRNAASLRHIIPIPSQPVFFWLFLLNAASLTEVKNSNSLLWTDLGLNPWSTTLEVSTLTITPPMWLLNFCKFSKLQSGIIPSQKIKFR